MDGYLFYSSTQFSIIYVQEISSQVRNNYWFIFRKKAAENIETKLVEFLRYIYYNIFV